MNKKLTELKISEIAIIKEVMEDEEQGVLLNLGIFIDSKLELIRPSVWGSPMVFKHGENQLIALRNDVASRILIEVIS